MFIKFYRLKIFLKIFVSFDPAPSLNVPQLLADDAAAANLKHNRQPSFLNGQTGRRTSSSAFKNGFVERRSGGKP